MHSPKGDGSRHMTSQVKSACYLNRHGHLHITTTFDMKNEAFQKNRLVLLENK